ncbi:MULTISPECIES: hypothetical protein [Cyanophyceae]|uniref:hypothetical protein n=1 Tax=Cyanophyceae TaxID=3028117 RepID=UPI001686ABB8|nr:MULTISPECIES: hypothetical protein [Cyanophyceae]MBD1915918.1 hypothetical protein [Phormidium sp. FACHB-77]MBD2030408.1 hypothetical protein [Phormidium sp. FACHB-322]MBD2053410.1 hypothetical protein [Leptolyngbya sp. FACHB-60]
MKLHPTLLAASALLALFSPTAVRADDGILSFELSQPQWAEQPPTAETVVAAPAIDVTSHPLPIPAQAANPPMRYHSPQQLPTGVYRRGVAVALNESTSATALLPPAPPLPEATVMVAVAPPPVAPEPQAELPKETPLLALDFGLEPSSAVVMAQAKLAEPKVLANPLPGLFEGHSDSLVAWAVGSAEGTRTPNGAINPAYFGHTDPGNRVWNMGTFSYQHGAKTPAEADQKQLARLQNQGDMLRERALKHGLNLTLEETLNGLDLANQSPLAAIGRVGYIERLAEAKANGYEGPEAILVARTRSYINPNTGRWNAPGLGNTEPSIRRDQQRRANAVAQAIAAYEAQNPDLHAQTWVLSPAPEPANPIALEIAAAEPVDEVLQMWTSPSDPVAQAEPVNEAIAAVPEQNAPETDPLAALWQVTVERFTQAAFPSGGSTSPQTASIANLLFNRGDTPSPTADTGDDGVAPLLPEEPSDGSANLVNPEGLMPLETAPVADSGNAEAVTEATPLAIAPLAHEVEAEAAAIPARSASQIASPSWADAKEGGQPVAAPVTTTSPIPGAFPDSTVYMPQSSAPAPEQPAAVISQEDAEALTNPTATPADLLPTLDPTSGAAEVGSSNAVPATELQVPSLENPSPADLTIVPAQEEPLGFEQVSTDDLSVETSPADVQTAGEEAIALPMLPSEVITPDTAREGASVQ